VTLNQSTVVKARVLRNGVWSALTSAEFSVTLLGVPLRITEIMYAPAGGDAYDYIELQNIGTTAVDLSGFSFDGITFNFVDGTILAPGAIIVLASSVNPAAFGARYSGSLSAVTSMARSQMPGAPRLIGSKFLNSDFRRLQRFGRLAYRRRRRGYSLEIVDPNGDPTIPPTGGPAQRKWFSWSSERRGGVANVRLNELMADNAGAVTNGGTLPDWIEIYNAGPSSVNLANWSLSNSGDPRKYVLPAGTTLGSNAYLVVWCDSQVSALAFIPASPWAGKARPFSSTTRRQPRRQHWIWPAAPNYTAAASGRVEPGS